MTTRSLSHNLTIVDGYVSFQIKADIMDLQILERNTSNYCELTFDILEQRNLDIEQVGGYKLLRIYASRLCYRKCTFLLDADPSLSPEDLILEMLQVGISAFYRAYRENLYGYRKSINYAKRSLVNSCNQIINSRTAQKKSRYISLGKTPDTEDHEQYRYSTVSLDKNYTNEESSVSLYSLIPSSASTENEAQQNELFCKLRDNFSNKEQDFLRAFIEGPQFHKSKQNIHNYSKYFNSIAKSFKLNPSVLRKKIISLLYKSEQDIGIGLLNTM